MTDNVTCPHCRRDISVEIDVRLLGIDNRGVGEEYEPRQFDTGHFALSFLCSNGQCRRVSAFIQVRKFDIDPMNELIFRASGTRLILPPGHSRSPCPAEVADANVHLSYEEACTVLPFSPMASAALSRRCLQRVLLDKGKATQSNLAQQIDHALKSGHLPTGLAENLDHVRNVGNFAAHPIKSKHTGEILDVEPGEAEWNLDVLEQLFDFYYVAPARAASKRAALDRKLAEAGKPPMKKPPT